MAPSLINNNNKKENSLFKRPSGILLDEKQWLYLKERYNMTNRELQVGILVCRGFNNGEIAKALKISNGTVKTHLRNLYRRVRVRSKVLLLLKLVEDAQVLHRPAESTTPPIDISEIPPKPGYLKMPSKK